MDFCNLKKKIRMKHLAQCTDFSGKIGFLKSGIAMGDSNIFHRYRGFAGMSFNKSVHCFVIINVFSGKAVLIYLLKEKSIEWNM